MSEYVDEAEFYVPLGARIMSINQYFVNYSFSRFRVDEVFYEYTGENYIRPMIQVLLDNDTGDPSYTPLTYGLGEICEECWLIGAKVVSKSDTYCNH